MLFKLTLLVVNCHGFDDRVEIHILVALLDVVLELTRQELYAHWLLLVNRRRRLNVLEGELKRSGFHF